MKSLILIAVLALGAQSTFATEKPSNGNAQIISMEVTETGFVPSTLHATPGKPATLRITRTTDATCATAISVPSRKVKVNLPLNKPTDVKLGKLTKGEIRFACGMGMLSGTIIVE